MTIDAETVLQILRQHDREGAVQQSPRAGQLRIIDTNNDVACAIEKLGGMEKAATLLRVSIEQLNLWIDEHYVPESFATTMKEHAGYSIQSLQEPSFYVFDGSHYWPHTPTKEELSRPTGIGLYQWLAPGVEKAEKMRNWQTLLRAAASPK